MRGRKKYAAEKYSPEDSLLRAESMARFGRYHDEAAWGSVLTFVSDRKKDPKKISDFYREYPQLCPKMMLSEWCKILINNRDAAGFVRLGEMMRVAEELSSAGREVVEPERVALLKANEDLYLRLSEAGKHKAEVKKAELVKYVTKIYPNVFLEIEQSDVLKMMRKMGLPRRPEWLVPGYIERIKKEIAAHRRRKGGK